MSASPNSDGTAAAVEALYDAYPYPGHGVVSSVVAIMLAPEVARLRAALGRRDLTCLDAGCGTGENALGIARAFPGVRVTGVDFSAAAVERAEALRAQHGADARFLMRDLSAPLADLGRFDLVVSVGVLHHLPEPRAGFAHLRHVTAAHTIFLGMVYGTFGTFERRCLRDALELTAGPGAPREDRLRLLAESELAPNRGLAHYLTTFRTRRRFGPAVPFREALSRVLKGRSAAYQADAFTHVTEATYTWAELVALLHATGWICRGWPERSGLPDQPSQLFRGEALARMASLPRDAQAAVYERIVRPHNLYFVATPA